LTQVGPTIAGEFEGLVASKKQKLTKKKSGKKKKSSGTKSVSSRKPPGKKVTKSGKKKKTATRKKTAVKKKATAKRTSATKGKLNASTIKKIYELLLQKRGLILGDLSSMESSALRASEQGSSSDNMADYGSDNYEQSFILGLMENVGSQIKEINSALERIESGSYGACDECGCSIPRARLEAIPWAKHCVNCKSKLESS